MRHEISPQIHLSFTLPSLFFISSNWGHFVGLGEETMNLNCYKITKMRYKEGDHLNDSFVKKAESSYYGMYTEHLQRMYWITHRAPPGRSRSQI